MSRWERSGVVVRWLQGGLLLETEGVGLVLDVPPGTAERLSADELGRIRTVALSSGRMRSVGGLVGLLCALEPHRHPTAPLVLRTALGEERGPMLAETWQRGWPGRYPLTIDSERPGATWDVGPLRITTLPLRGGEPRWLPEPDVAPVTGLGFRIEAGGVTIAWTPAAASLKAVARLVHGTDLAIVEAGIEPWPRSPHRWRLLLTEAIEAASGAAETWIVTDDGAFAGEQA